MESGKDGKEVQEKSDPQTMSRERFKEEARTRKKCLSECLCAKVATCHSNSGQLMVPGQFKADIKMA